MKVNFQETVKQKTDKELEIISKDYVFYSEEERLVALDELESRNSLSEELSMNKKNIESSLEIPIITEQASEAVKSEKRIYKDRAIWVATYFGGPLVAGYLIAENFKAFNETDKAKKTWIYTITGTIIMFGGIFSIPNDIREFIPRYFIPLIYTAIAYGVIKQYQRNNISAFIALGGKPFGWWRTIIVSSIGLAIMVASIFAFAFIFVALINV
jgi:hypothetical protein